MARKYEGNAHSALGTDHRDFGSVVIGARVNDGDEAGDDEVEAFDIADCVGQFATCGELDRRQVGLDPAVRIARQAG